MRDLSVFQTMNIRILTHFPPIFHICTTWKRQKTFGFQGVQKWNIGKKCVERYSIWVVYRNSKKSFILTRFWKVAMLIWTSEKMLRQNKKHETFPIVFWGVRYLCLFIWNRGTDLLHPVWRSAHLLSVPALNFSYWIPL